MSLFKYTVTNKEGRRLSGTIEATTELLARKELNNMDFSILEFSEIPQETLNKLTEGHEKFEFEAIDIHSKIVKGTIPALNIEVASKRLKNEYDLTVLAIWKENSSPEEIEKAKEEGKLNLKKFLDELSQKKLETNKSTETQENQEFVKLKVDTILKKVLVLLQKFDKEFEGDVKNEINKKIDKVLRIKNSTNTEYILSSAKELLSFIEEQTNILEKKGFHDKRIELKLETNSLLNELKKNQKPQSLKEDINSKIEKWQKKYKVKNELSRNFFTKFISNLLNFILKALESPEEIAKIKEEIIFYKKQRLEFFKLIFKEPTKEYRKKLFVNIRAINQKIKSSKEKIKELKGKIKKESISSTPKDNEIKLSSNIINELTTLSGFIIGTYLIYYFLIILIDTENIFNLRGLKGFEINPNGIFKYLLIIFFLSHSAFAIKSNFFKSNKIASLIILLITPFLILLSIYNF